MTVQPIQPQDHKSATFAYTTKGGVTLVVPRFDSVVTFGRARKLRKLAEDEQVFQLVEDVCDDDALAVLDAMPASEVGLFFEAWQKDSGVDLGESTSSSS